jgi:multiple sugar transport system permease protein
MVPLPRFAGEEIPAASVTDVAVVAHFRRARHRAGVTARDRWLAYGFVAPAVLLVGVLMYYPMIGTFYESLFTTSFINPQPRFAGLETYRKIFADPGFWQVAVNSVVWTVGVVALQNVVGFFTALLLNRGLPGQGLLRSLILMPWVLPGVVAAILWRFMYDPQLGLINSFIIGWGISDQGIGWLADTATAMGAAILAAVWKGFPFSTVVYLAALQNVDQEQLEAAQIDGAGPIRRLIHVVIPSVRHVMAVNLLLTSILTFNYFDMVWVLTRGGPLNATHIFPTKIYELGFGQFRFGDAAAYGAISVLVLIVFIAFYLLLQRREAEEA